MRPGGIIAAAIEVIADIETRHRPATDALRDWGLSHRFAGAGDRAAIGNLVFDALRARASIAWRMGDDGPRALALGTCRWSWDYEPERIAAAFGDDRHAPAPLEPAERAALAGDTGLDAAPAHVAGDFPEWLSGSLDRVFSDDTIAETRALAQRAPLDLRVNTLRSDRERVLRALARFAPGPTPFSPVGVRLSAGRGSTRQPHVQSEAGYAKGWFEVQDEGSQLAALMCAAGPGMQVADICAGAGGKTLALATAMDNRGQIHAWDADRRRLANIHERLQRAKVRNAQVLDAGEVEALGPLQRRMDVVLVDAPCTGSGVWRRRPDAKWRVTPAALSQRLEEQMAALALASSLVKPGGRLVYVTCSVLPEENEDQVAAFVTGNADFVPTAPADVMEVALPGVPELAQAALMRPAGAMFTPRRTGTDGFFVSVMTRRREQGA